ncbi:Protein G12 [Formica fusca]
MMKFTYKLMLFAVLSIIGLGQAHQAPDFGKGPLHEDMQDILDLIPVKEINNICQEYLRDPEIQAAMQYILTTTIIEDLMLDFEAIPEVINLFNYLQKEGIEIYFLINEINKALGIKELEPSISHSAIKKRTGGIAGFFKDIRKVLPSDDFIHIYVQKMKTSQTFVRYINQLKSNNFQQIVNKVHKIKSFQIILNGLKNSGVNTQIVADVMFIVLGITVPN